MIHHRDGIRPRPIDDQKPYFIIKDLAQAKLNSTKEELAELCTIEKELIKVLEYYDKIRKNEIPKSKIINEKNEKKEKNQNKINYHINNNIIYINDNHDSTNTNNNAYILNYKLSEYKRPDNYIIYSSSEKNKINNTKKVYEAKDADNLFLKIRDNFMKIDELENIITELENNCTNEKDEKISEENAHKIIEQKYPKYKKYMDSIINHFKDRRSSIKKSLIRKKWHINKSSDKYLNNTFRKRERDKIKTRKNNQNKEESINKIIEAELYCKNYLLPLMNDMTNKEVANKHLYKIDELIFLSECDKIKKSDIPPNRIKENNTIKEYIEKNMKTTFNKKLDFNDIKTNKDNKNKLNHNTGSNTHNNKASNSITINGNSTNTSDKIEEINYTIINNKPIKENKNKIIDDNISVHSNSHNTNNSRGDDIRNKSMHNNTHSNSYNNINKKYNTERKILINKNNIKNKSNEVFPLLSLNSLLNKNINLKEDEETTNNTNNNNSSYIKNKNNNLRIRIRINRSNKITIDRYRQKKNDLNPFHDSYNDVINDYNKYADKTCNYLNKKNFENLLYTYNLNKTKNLNLLYDSDDDSIDINNDIKQFSNSYKQFLKFKRNHSNNM